MKPASDGPGAARAGGAGPLVGVRVRTPSDWSSTASVCRSGTCAAVLTSASRAGSAKFSTSTMRLSSSETGAPSIFQYSPMKSDQGSSEPKITRSPPIPCFSISTSSQRAPKPIAHEVSV